MNDVAYSDRRFMFVYLNTGNGHIAQARVLQEAMAEYAPQVQVMLQNGFSHRNRLAQSLMQNGYGFACNYLHGAWPLIYELGEHRFVQKIVRHSLKFQTLGYFKKLLRRNRITDVVSFHFALSPSLHDAIRAVDRNIRMTVIATDPFTGPRAWFYKPSLDYLVSSEQFRQFGISCGVRPERIQVMPFLLNKKFRQPATPEERAALRQQYGFAQDKRLVLLAGGGEGLPGTLKIISQCVMHRAPFAVAVVCGRNAALKKSLDLLAKANGWLDLHVYGFVDFMDSLIQMSDLIVSKAGASSVMEIVSLRKPVIINTYIHGQELGNMRFAVQNGAGFFIRHSADIYKKIARIFESDASYRACVAQFQGLAIDTDVSKIVSYLLKKH